MNTLTEVKTITFDQRETTAFVAGVKAVAMSAAADGVRPIICGICIEISDNVMTLIATDSYRLTTVEMLPVPELGDMETIIINAKQLVSALPKGRNSIMSLTFDHRQLLIASPDGPSFTLPHIEGTYPGWRTLTSEYGKVPINPVVIGFNPKLLASLMKSADTFRGKTDAPVQIHPALTALKPVHMEMTVIDVGRWYSLLMPVRIP